jgi:hypothetical protein
MNEPEPGRTRGEVVEIHPGRRRTTRAERAADRSRRAARARDDTVRASLPVARRQATGGGRHRQRACQELLRAGPVTLPLLNVDLPLLGFYWVAPALFVLLHLNLLLQLYLLSGKLHRLDQAIRPPGSEKHETEAQQDRRAQLYPFPFTHMLIGRQQRWLMRFLLWLIVVLTVLVLPVLLLLLARISQTRRCIGALDRR